MKKLVLGLGVGLFLGLASGVIAATSERVEAVFVEYAYEVNGEVREVDTPALLYHGTSHLPTRVIANMLGYDVTFLADSKTIQFTTPDAPRGSEVLANEEGDTQLGLFPLPIVPIEDQIEMIDARIESAKGTLAMLLQLQKKAPESDLSKSIAKAQAMIEELEQQKAELESRLN